jgi:hypothetical protein
VVDWERGRWQSTKRLRLDSFGGMIQDEGRGWRKSPFERERERVRLMSGKRVLNDV